tara:strand:+ start:2405 stop:3508 length:1104 start_codon:yes stop_codon:yes gene_type:complete
MINFDDRLVKLKDRRQGTVERNRLEIGLESISTDFRINENYEQLKENSAIKYVIGSMAAVSEKSTETSIAEGERVATTLIGLLETAGVSTEFKMQGSVALDIHIEGYSDVDMLILKKGIVGVETPTIGNYSPPSDPRPLLEIVKEIRTESEAKLTSRYHAAVVDCNGSKSIAVSGGSLMRHIDIVPSCWYDSLIYQSTQMEHDRPVKIYDKSNHCFIENSPFLHIKRVNDKDAHYGGNLKKVIRLMKNIRADMPDNKKRTAKALSSYDLAGIAFHMDDALQCSQYLPLALLEKTRWYLSLLVASQPLRDLITVPDNTRKVFNEDAKLAALTTLCDEVDALAKAVQKAIEPTSYTYNSDSLTSRMIYM